MCKHAIHHARYAYTQTQLCSLPEARFIFKQIPENPNTTPNMVYVTVTVINKDFTLIEKPDAQRPANGMSLCRIFNDLEREGYTLVGAGGAVCIRLLAFEHSTYGTCRSNLFLCSTSLVLWEKPKRRRRKRRKKRRRKRMTRARRSLRLSNCPTCQ